MSFTQEMSKHEIYLARLAHAREQQAIGLKLAQTVESVVSERQEKAVAQQREAVALQKKELALQERDAAIAEIERLKVLLNNSRIDVRDRERNTQYDKLRFYLGAAVKQDK